MSVDAPSSSPLVGKAPASSPLVGEALVFTISSSTTTAQVACLRLTIRVSFFLFSCSFKVLSSLPVDPIVL